MPSAVKESASVTAVRQKGRILVGQHDGVYILKFVGDVRLSLCTAVDQFLDAMFEDRAFQSVVVDLTMTAGIDSTSLGILAKLSINAHERFGAVPTLVSTNPDITRILFTMGFDDVFNIVRQPLEEPDQLGELPASAASEEDMRQRVLEAHRYLMSLNESNREAFRDLVEALEGCGPPVELRRHQLS
jgi:anti-anti-sigma factor